jgi:hypothetical protein
MRSRQCRAARLIALCPIWPRWLAALGLAAASLLLAVEAAGASPSRYVYEVCDSALAGGGSAGVIWAPHPTLPFGGEDSCAQPGGALVIRQGEVSPGGAAYWGVPIAAPSGSRVESITVNAASCASPPSAGNVEVGYESGWPAPNCSFDTRTFGWEEGIGGATVELACSGECHAGPWVAARFFAATLVDSSAPTIEAAGGTLLEGGVRRGHQSLTASGADRGGGVASMSVLVNGLPAGEPRRLACNVARVANPSVAGTVAAQPSPCPLRAAAAWTLDTAAYPFHNGANTVQVCASDFATLGEANTSCAARTVEVDDSCAEAEVGGGAALSAEFTRSHSDTVTVGYGRGALLRGLLSDQAGDPVAGARLCLKMRTEGIAAAPRAVGTVRTDAEGRYSYRVAPGPNREIVVGYRNDASQLAREVRFYARAGPSLKLSPPRLRNGERVELWGRLPGPRPGRRVVVLQAGIPSSSRWITFRRATSDARGAFRAGYRFKSTRRRTRYRFRAVVPSQDAYPWVGGHSKPVSVLVGP